MRVFVYRNLRKKCYSVKALEGEHRGKVVGHVDFIALKDVTFKVSEAGRQRVLREKRKNVHAGVVGTTTYAGLFNKLEKVSYNPYKASSFVDENGLTKTAADLVLLDENGVFIIERRRDNQ